MNEYCQLCRCEVMYWRGHMKTLEHQQNQKYGVGKVGTMPPVSTTMGNDGTIPPSPPIGKGLVSNTVKNRL